MYILICICMIIYIYIYISIYLPTWNLISDFLSDGFTPVALQGGCRDGADCPNCLGPQRVPETDQGAYSTDKGIVPDLGGWFIG